MNANRATTTATNGRRNANSQALAVKKEEATAKIKELQNIAASNNFPPTDVVGKVEALQKVLIEYLMLKLKEQTESKEKVDALQDMLKKFTEIFGRLGENIVKLNSSPNNTFHDAQENFPHSNVSNGAVANGRVI